MYILIIYIIIKFTSFFYKLRSLVPFEYLCKIYYAFIFPYINYRVEIYANCTKLVLDKLIKLNNKLLQILLNKNYDTPPIELYRSFNVLPIPLLYEMKMLEIVHKYYFHFYLFLLILVLVLYLYLYFYLYLFFKVISSLIALFISITLAINKIYIYLLLIPVLARNAC